MDKEPNGRISEQSQQMRSIPHAQLRAVLIQGTVTPIMEPIFDSPMGSNYLQEPDGASPPKSANW
jgi:hypothetical protein